MEPLTKFYKRALFKMIFTRTAQRRMFQNMRHTGIIIRRRTETDGNTCYRRCCQDTKALRRFFHVPLNMLRSVLLQRIQHALQ